VLFCAYITAIQNFVEWATGTAVFSADVYMLSHIPAKIDWSEVGGIVGAVGPDEHRGDPAAGLARLAPRSGGGASL
jgi:hypothetical protein